jgi:hypothetical protein
VLLYPFLIHSHIWSSYTVFLLYPTVAAGVNAEPIVAYTGGVIYESKWYEMMVNHVSPNNSMDRPGRRRGLTSPMCAVSCSLYLSRFTFAFPQWLYSVFFCCRWCRLLDGEPTPIRTSSIGSFATRGDNVSKLVCV